MIERWGGQRTNILLEKAVVNSAFICDGQTKGDNGASFDLEEGTPKGEGDAHPHGGLGQCRENHHREEIQRGRH